MNKPISIAIIDEIPLVRHGLACLLANERDMHLAGEARDGFEALALAQDLTPDVMILEPRVPKKSGLDMIRAIACLARPPKILIVTEDQSTYNAWRSLKAGAHGWLPKTASCEEIITAVRTIHKSRLYLNSTLKQMFAEWYLNPERSSDPSRLLTDREFEVMRLLSHGKTNREISELFHISVKTVDKYRSSLLRKLDLRNNADITRFAIEEGFTANQ
jgi:DNA-binding NarL/FixJ family response regulator